MPLKLVKSILNIYEENDPDKDTIDINKLFEHIINLIETNGIIPISADAPIIKNLREIILPYYRLYITLVITELKQLLDTYLYYIYTQSKNIQIIVMCLCQRGFIDSAKIKDLI